MTDFALFIPEGQVEASISVLELDEAGVGLGVVDHDVDVVVVGIAERKPGTDVMVLKKFGEKMGVFKNSNYCKNCV
jgi:hypothetical protein